MRASMVTFVALSGLLVGCGDSSPVASGGQGAGHSGAKTATKQQARRSIFDDAYRFRCSQDRAVGCQGVFPVRRGDADTSRIALLSRGEDSLRARIATLRAARRSVRIQALIFRADETGLLVAELLKQKKAAGLDVRVIVDATSNLDWHTQWMYFDLERHGIVVEGYEALYLQWLTADIVATDPLRANKRFHDKMWVIDGEDPTTGVAVVGGLNVANEYFRVATTPGERWRDQDVLVRGPIVRDVVRAFDRNFTYFEGLKNRLPAMFNPNNAWRHARDLDARIGRVRTPTWERPELRQALDRILAEAPRLEPIPVVARFLQSRPRHDESYIAQAYLDLIGRARQRVFIANAYFVPTRALIAALHAAARRGVEVVIVTNSPTTNDIAAVATASRWLDRTVLEINRAPGMRGKPGITIREWDGPSRGEGTLHAKFAVADGSEAIIGSYNLDPRSERLNSETALAIQSPQVAAELERWYREEYVAKSTAVTWADAVRYHDAQDAENAFHLAYSLSLREWL